MLITIVCTLIFMLAYFLILLGAVGFIQNKKFFGSAPKCIQDAIPDTRERFPGAHMIGWIIIALAFILFILAVVLAVWDGAGNSFGFISFFVRFIVMLYGLELFDLGVFDYILLCHSNFYPRFYPEVKDIVGPHLFGFNKKVHAMHFLVYIPVSAVAALICSAIW